MQPAAQSILDVLRRMRRRAFVVLVVSYALAGIVYATLGCVIFSLVLPLADLALAPLLASVTAAVLCGAAGLATLKRPSLYDVATLIDRTCQLQQRLQTALDCIHQQDDVAILLQQDASHHLYAVDSTRVLPFNIRLGRKGLLVFALVWVSVSMGIRYMAYSGGRFDVSALFPATHEREQRTLQDRGHKHMTGEETSQLTSELSAQAISTAAAPQRHTSPSPDVTSTAPTVQPGQALPPQEVLPATRTHTVEEAGMSEGRPLPMPAAERDNAAAPLPSLEESSVSRLPQGAATRGLTSEDRLGRRGASPIDTPRGRDDRPASRAMPQGGNQGNRQGHMQAESPSEDVIIPERPVAHHASTTAPRSSEDYPPAPRMSRVDREGAAHSRAGGSSELPAALDGLPASDTANLAMYRYEYQRAWDAAEAVLAREQIPPGMQRYVREYFVVIHPERQ